MNTCPHCRNPIYAVEKTHPCDSCKTTHHRKCWDDNGGCAAEGCPECVSSKTQGALLDEEQLAQRGLAPPAPSQTKAPQNTPPGQMPQASSTTPEAGKAKEEEKYWLHRDGQRYGPYEKSTLQKYLATKNASRKDRIQGDDSRKWTTVGQLLGDASVGGTENQGPPTRETSIDPQKRFRPPKPESPMVWAVLATLCCCLPFGVVAIVFAAQIDSKYAAGDYNGAIESADKAKTWCWIAFGVGLVVQTLIGILQFAAEAAGGGY